MHPVTDESGRLRAPWRLLVQYLSYRVVAALLVNLGVVSWLLVRSGPGVLTSWGRSVSDLIGYSEIFLISNLASVAAALLTVWLAGRLLDRRSFRDFGFRLDAGWWLDLFFGMVLGALLMTGIFLTQLVLGWAKVTGSFEAAGGSAGAPFALAILLPLAAFVCVGVAEETVFRGYGLRNAAEGLGSILGPRVAVLAAWGLTSLFFGMLHAFNPNATVLSTVNIVLAGVLLGIGYVLTGQLAIPIGLHVTWNFFQGNVFGFPVSGLEPVGAVFLSIGQDGPVIWTGGAFGPEGGLLVTAAIPAGCLLISAWVRLRYGRLDIHIPLAEAPEKRAPSAAESRTIRDG